MCEWVFLCLTFYSRRTPPVAGKTIKLLLDDKRGHTCWLWVLLHTVDTWSSGFNHVVIERWMVCYRKYLIKFYINFPSEIQHFTTKLIASLWWVTQDATACEAGHFIRLAAFKAVTQPRVLEPLWQKVSLRSSPVFRWATHKSLLLMKAMKSGSPGQILGSMRVPEHCVLISTGFTGADC